MGISHSFQTLSGFQSNVNYLILLGLHRLLPIIQPLLRIDHHQLKRVISGNISLRFSSMRAHYLNAFNSAQLSSINFPPSFLSIFLFRIVFPLAPTLNSCKRLSVSAWRTVLYILHIFLMLCTAAMK